LTLDDLSEKKCQLFFRGLLSAKGLKLIHPFLPEIQHPDTNCKNIISLQDDLWWPTFKKIVHFFTWPTYCRRFEVNPPFLPEIQHPDMTFELGWPTRKQSVHFFMWPTYCRRFEVNPSFRSGDKAFGHTL